MRRHVIAFFLISLTAELGASWLQFGLRARDGKGLYYLNFVDLLAMPLACWFTIFCVLTAAWLLISRRSRPK